MMFTLDELELIKKAAKFYAQNDGIEDEITSDIMRSIAECIMIKDFHTAHNLAEIRAKEATEKRKNLEDRLVLLQAKLIEIEDRMVADNV